MDEFETLRQRVRDAQIVEPPAPWKKLASYDITGVTDVGFAEDSELILVISGHAREIFDGTSGKRVARDQDMDGRRAWYGRHDLIGRGFGPLAGKEIRLAGVSGGGLAAFSRDGWGAVRLAVDWPIESLLLSSPYSSVYQSTTQFWKIATGRETVAWGFSFTGDTLLCALTEQIMIFGK